MVRVAAGGESLSPRLESPSPALGDVEEEASLTDGDGRDAVDVDEDVAVVPVPVLLVATAETSPAKLDELGDKVFVYLEQALQLLAREAGISRVVGMLRKRGLRPIRQRLNGIQPVREAREVERQLSPHNQLLQELIHDQLVLSRVFLGRQRDL